MCQGPPVRDIATEAVETVILNFVGPFPNLSRKGSTHELHIGHSRSETRSVEF